MQGPGWGVVAAFLPITLPPLLLPVVKARGLPPHVRLQPLVILQEQEANRVGGGMGGLHSPVLLLLPFLAMQWMGLHTSLGV
jgi:hypothetical protein